MEMLHYPHLKFFFNFTEKTISKTLKKKGKRKQKQKTFIYSIC